MKWTMFHKISIYVRNLLSYFVTTIHWRKHKIWLVQKGHLHFKCILFSEQMIMKQYEVSGLINYTLQLSIYTYYI